jgi:hypothetical protein
MAKIYISSTYEDLKKEREAAAKAIRRLGHRTIAMEDYVASDKRPVDKCLEDVRASDAYIGIFAWRYGHIPDGYDKSITHLEYEEAKKAGKECLIFLLGAKAPWPVEKVDKGEAGEKIDRLRSQLQENHTVSFFYDAGELSGLVGAAVMGLNPDKETKGETNLGPLVSKMCDRFPQVREFWNFFQKKSKECRGRPQFYSLHGDKSECHESLLERLINTCLKDYVEKEWGEEKPKPPSHGVPWPKDGSLGERKEQLLFNLMDRLQTWEGIELFTANRLARLPRFNKHPLVTFRHTISDSRWDNTTEQLITWYIREYWAALECDDHIPHFLIFFNIEYRLPGEKGLKRKIFKRRYASGEHIRQRLQHIFRAADAACPCRVIKELTPIELEDVIEWFRLNKIYRYEEKRRKKAESIFTINNKVVPCRCMAEIEIELLKIVNDYQQQKEAL